MRILLVEDRDDDVELIQDGLAARGLQVELTVARSRDGALDELTRSHFDLLLCDLKIPTVDYGLDTAVEHGIAVYEEARALAPGLPAIFFSAFGSEEILDQHVLPRARQDDLFGVGAESMLYFKDKGKLSECLDIVEHFHSELGVLDALELVLAAKEDVALDYPDQRLLRICARSFGAQRVGIRVLSGGLSAAKTLQADGVDSLGNPRLHGVVKIADYLSIERDVVNFQRLAGLLPPGVLAPLAKVFRAGGSSRAAVVYSLAADCESLFRVIANDPLRAAEIVRRLAAKFRSLAVTDRRDVLNVGDVRRLFVSDEEMASFSQQLQGIDTAAVERLEVQVTPALAHGDLHGSNILVDQTGEPVVIDFGSAMEATASLDPVVLELSLIFHPYGRRLVPDVDPAVGESWGDLESYLDVCSVPPFVSECRTWANSAAGSEGEVLANAYAWSIRQFRYPRADHSLAQRLASGCSRRLLAEHNQV